MSEGSKRVFVGNLAYRTRWQDLKDFMRMDGQLNVVYANVLTDFMGRSKGCGIVEYETAEEAQRAIHELHDAELDGRRIFVREDREHHRPTSPPRRHFMGMMGGGMPRRNMGKSLFVSNLPSNTRLTDLTNLFSSVGTVVRSEVKTDRDGNTRHGIVEFATREEASDAIASLDGTEYGGNVIGVRLDRY